MDSSLVTQVSVGGAVAVIIIREVLGFLRDTKAKSNGGISRAEFEEHKKSAQYKDTCETVVESIKARFTSLDTLHEERKEYQQQRFDVIDESLREVKGLVRDLK